MRCFIFGALEVKSLPYLPVDGDLVIAADKGYETLKKLNISPDIIVGDFDSLGYIPKEIGVEKLNVRKDDTDTAHAVEIAFKKGYKDFVFYGCAGGRLDHTIANIQLAKHIASVGGSSLFVGNEEAFTVIKDGSISFDEGRHGRVSVFSLSDISTGVTEEGLLYALNDSTLYNDNPLGVSNEFTGRPSKISVKNGYLLIITETK